MGFAVLYHKGLKKLMKDLGQAHVGLSGSLKPP